MRDYRYDAAETERRSDNLLRVGKITAVDYAAARAEVQIGDAEQVTDWIPFLTPRGGQDRTWFPPDVGEQVLVACPFGDFAQGIVLGALYQTAHPAPGAAAGLTRIQMRDGAVIEHDSAAHQTKIYSAAGAVHVEGATTVMVKAGTSVTVQAPAVTIDAAATTVTGTLTVQGLLAYLAGMTGATGSGSTATITGNMNVTGNITAGGDIIDGGSNTNHHSH